MDSEYLRCDDAQMIHHVNRYQYKLDFKRTLLQFTTTHEHSILCYFVVQKVQQINDDCPRLCVNKGQKWQKNLLQRSSTHFMDALPECSKMIVTSVICFC